MVSQAPPFWWKKADWRAWALLPASLIYGAVAGRRMARAVRAAVDAPVVCIGNFTVGGAGKTPTAIAIARAARARGLTPGFLSRGYSGSLDVATVVDPLHHDAAAVGDEPLLLAKEALTVISRRRLKGAKKLVEAGANLIIMDDGFQSASIAIDFALVVIDARRGIGNGHIVPGGPVRAPLHEQMRHVSALLKVGSGHAADGPVRQAARAGKPVYLANVEPVDSGQLAGRKLLAFAGIADPDKFYRTVEAMGGEIVARRNFPDHYHFASNEIDALLNDADRQGLDLVTTTKDAVRLSDRYDRSKELAERVRVVEIDMAFNDPRTPHHIIDAAIAAFRARRLKAKV